LPAATASERPSLLAKGDRVAIIAPSSPFDEDAYHAGAEWLSTRYEVAVRDDVHARRGYLAGDDTRRRQELDDALADPSVRAIVAARGGYGATRIVSCVDWSKLRAHPKWIVGFSDVTALHNEALAVGVRSLHAPMLAWLGTHIDARDEWIAAVERADYGDWSNLEVVRAGDAEGVSFGGNLALLETLAAAGRLRVPDSAILFIDDCTERPYRLDRMLTSLLVGGHLARVAGVVVGSFTDCHPGADGVTADEVARERLAVLGVPIVANAPFGHGSVNRPFPIGARCRIRAGGVTFDE
jgi:muramoyltetrapeptide carboxypeptidase